jgi:Spy/CpxP family protein refolding chaperone
MNKLISRLTSLSGALMASVILNAAIAFAQNPPPRQPDGSTNADQNAAGRRDRGNRGPGGGGNPQGGNLQGGGRGNFGGWGLDEKQTELLREAMQADTDEIRKLDEKLRAAQKELVQAVIAEKYDEKIVREKAEAVAKIQTEITMLRAKQVATVAPTLKPEQREQWENSQIALGLLMRGGGGPGNAGFANAGNNRFGGGGPGGGGPGNAGLGRGDRGGFQPGTPDGLPPGGRNLRRNSTDPNATDQPRRRGGNGQ